MTDVHPEGYDENKRPYDINAVIFTGHVNEESVLRFGLAEDPTGEADGSWHWPEQVSA